MDLRNQPKKKFNEEIRLTLDARKRISLAKLLPDCEICSLKAYKEGDKIILEPMAEIPARELWLYKNPKAFEALQEGLDQSEQGKIKKLNRDFTKFIDDEI